MKNKTFPSKYFSQAHIDPEYTKWSKEIRQLYKKYGIPNDVFSSVYNDIQNNKDKDKIAVKHPYRTSYEEEAAQLITIGEPLPKELEKKLLDTLPERLERNKKREERQKIIDELSPKTQEEIEAMFDIDLENQTMHGIKFKDIIKLHEKAQRKKKRK